MSIRPISAEATRPLRQRVLRPHQTIDELDYPGDDAPTTLHLGAFKNDKLVGISSLYLEPPPGTEQPNAWRLRGVATAPEVRGEGYGSELLLAAIAHVAAQGGTYLWCNARTPVLGYYERYSFQRQGEEFESPGTGLHYFVWRAVVPEDTILYDLSRLTSV
jgi:predicted GNAT family N-acyltransferase